LSVALAGWIVIAAVNAQQLNLQFRDEKVTLRSEERPLSALLDEITQVTGIPFVVAPAIADSPISCDVRELPVDAAIRQLLSPYDAFLFYASDTPSRAVLKVVWVYPKGRGSSIRPVPKELWASTREIEAQLSDADAGVRARAYETLIERKRAGAASDVLRCLREERDPSVRTRVLYSALKRGISIPISMLTALLTADPSEQIRFMALEALHDDPNIAGFVANALTDPSPLVQDRAREMLEELKTRLAGREPVVER
jgi:hypothetical protein